LHRDHAAIAAARTAIRALIETERRNAPPDPAVRAENLRRFKADRAARARAFAAQRRILVHAFRAASPAAVVLIDIQKHRLETLVGPELGAVADRLAAYDVIVGLAVRRVLQSLGIDPGPRQLAELGSHQKTRKLNKRGRKLVISTELLIQGSCNISRASGDPATMRAYLRDGQTTKLRRRLEADAKSLLALYRYGCLHHCLRLRWGFLDERVPAPWADQFGWGVYSLIEQAEDLDVPLEVVLGTAPAWEDPWARASLVRPRRFPGDLHAELIDDRSQPVHIPDIQAARLARPHAPRPSRAEPTASTG
jgi:hypothetical protein